MSSTPDTPAVPVSRPVDLEAWERLARAVIDSRLRYFANPNDDTGRVEYAAALAFRDAIDDPERILGLIEAARGVAVSEQNDEGKTENGRKQEPGLSQEATDAAADAPAPGEMLQPNIRFEATELWAAYRAGAQSARHHHPVTDELVERSADAYVKHAHLSRPRFDWSALVAASVVRPTSEERWEEIRGRVIEAVRTLGDSVTAKEIVAHLHERYDRVAIALSACAQMGRLVRRRSGCSCGYVYAIPPAATDSDSTSVVLASDPSRSSPDDSALTPPSPLAGRP